MKRKKKKKRLKKEGMSTSGGSLQVVQPCNLSVPFDY